MNIFIVGQADTGGIGGQLKLAFDQYAPGWNVECMFVQETYLAYPGGLAWDEERARALYAGADAVHLFDSFDLYRRFDGGLRKPAIMHHHGTPLRTAPRIHDQAIAVGATEVVSTVDLLRWAPGATWLPAPHDLDRLATYRRPERGSAVRIVQAPTSREKKGTAAVLDAIERLRRRHDIEFDLIEGVSWEECLARKGTADILVDQFTFGYGNNSIEAWAMGIPVVSGASDPKIRHRMRELWGELPFYEASEKSIEQRLGELIRSRELREEWGERGRAHVRKWHERAAVVEQMKSIYAAARPSGGVELLGPPVWPGGPSHLGRLRERLGRLRGAAHGWR